MGRELIRGLDGQGRPSPWPANTGLRRKRGDWKFPVRALHPTDRAAGVEDGPGVSPSRLCAQRAQGPGLYLSNYNKKILVAQARTSTFGIPP